MSYVEKAHTSIKAAQRHLAEFDKLDHPMVRECEDDPSLCPMIGELTMAQRHLADAMDVLTRAAKAEELVV